MADGSSIEVIPSGAALGAEIVGLDLSGEVDDANFEKVLQAWADHLVLRFRG